MTKQKMLIPSVAAVLAAIGLSPLAFAGHAGACSKTSHLMHVACRAEIRDDLFVQKAKCYNEKENDEKRECLTESLEEFREARELCGDQFVARQDVCADIGEAPFDPRFEPEDFDTSLSALTTPNRYFPMGVGYRWTYGGDEEIEIEVLDETKLIDDVVCFVVRDVVFEDGLLVEDTNDWFALAKADGSVWYCGEEAKDFEFFEGDVPSLPELVSIDGSFKVERDGDRSGVVFPGNQRQVGDVFRQEFSLGNAEDIGEVVSVSYGYGSDPELDQLVPEALADYLCNDDCVVIAEYSPLDPEAFEYKYYALDVGFFLGTNPVDEEVVFITGCSFNSGVCDNLPEIDD